MNARRKWQLTLVIALAALIGTSGCRPPSANAEKDANWGPVSNGLQCRLLPLEQTLEVAEGTMPEDVEVYVTYELRNVGEKPLKFLAWDTPLEKTRSGDIFRVEGPAGKQVDYVGKYIDRGPPKPKHYVAIAPGQTLSNRVWPSYDFRQLGLYEVSVTTAPEPERMSRWTVDYYGGDAEKAKENPDNVWTGTLRSNTVALKVVRAKEDASGRKNAGNRVLRGIPDPDPAKWASVRDAVEWRNPYIVVYPEDVLLRGSPKRIQVGQLRETLLGLPASAWPYGRVVAVQEIGIRSGDDDTLIQRTLDQVLSILAQLGVRVELWPSS